MGISYSKAEKANAAGRDKDLFSCGYAEARGTGSGEFAGPMDWSLANALWAFCFAVYSGDSPADAFAKTVWPAGGKKADSVAGKAFVGAEDPSA